MYVRYIVAIGKISVVIYIVGFLRICFPNRKVSSKENTKNIIIQNKMPNVSYKDANHQNQ